VKSKQQQQQEAFVKQYQCTVPTAVVDAQVDAQREQVRQGMVKELDLRTKLLFSAYGVKTLEEFTRANQLQPRVPPVQVRDRLGRVMAMSIENALGGILRGALTLAEP
jgi:hypothetical protein